MTLPDKLNLARFCLEKSAKTAPDKPALKIIHDLGDTPEIWRYGDLQQAVLRVSALLLGNGLNKGDHVLIRLENGGFYAIAFFAAIAAGLVPVPASSQLSKTEIGFLLKNSEARAIFTGQNLSLPELASKLIEITQADIAQAIAAGQTGKYADTGSNDPAFLTYTSGTSGTPKGVVHGHRHILGRQPMYRDWYGLERDDIMLHAGAFNWTYTLGAGLMDVFVQTATSVLYTGARDVQVWPALMAQQNATLFAAVPMLYRQILKHCDISANDIKTLRHGLCAGEPLSPGLYQEWRDKTGLELYEALGMSEISTYISSGPKTPVRPGAVGKVQRTRKIAILSIEGGTEPCLPNVTGFLAIDRTDPGLMLGLWRRPEEEAALFRGAWFCGGDLAHIDDDGYIWFDGRADDIINAMGYRISPLEVESALMRHNGVSEAAVCAIEVKPDVFIIAAFVVTNSDKHIDGEALKRFAAEHLGAYKIPREIVFVDQLPKTANGKVKRAELVSLI